MYLTAGLNRAPQKALAKFLSQLFRHGINIEAEQLPACFDFCGTKATGMEFG
jgi:hypothetical protein